jgi:hypothetical protein
MAVRNLALAISHAGQRHVDCSPTPASLIEEHLLYSSSGKNPPPWLSDGVHTCPCLYHTPQTLTTYSSSVLQRSWLASALQHSVPSPSAPANAPYYKLRPRDRRRHILFQQASQQVCFQPTTFHLRRQKRYSPSVLLQEKSDIL